MLSHVLNLVYGKGLFIFEFVIEKLFWLPRCGWCSASDPGSKLACIWKKIGTSSLTASNTTRHAGVPPIFYANLRLYHPCMHHSMLLYNYARTKACLYVNMLMNACLCIYWKHVSASHEYSCIGCMYKHALNVCICTSWLHVNGLTESIPMHSLDAWICMQWMYECMSRTDYTEMNLLKAYPYMH